MPLRIILYSIYVMLVTFLLFLKPINLVKVFRYLEFSPQKHKIYFQIWFRIDVFFDAQIKVKKNGCDTWTWHKTTHTGLLLHFDALFPLKWKSGLYCAYFSFKLVFKNDVIKLR